MLQDRIAFSNISASQTFTILCGGRYLVSVTGSNFGTVAVQKLAPDGTTYVDLTQAFNMSDDSAAIDQVIGSFGAAGAKALDLAPGQYQLTISSATAVYAEIARCPQA